LLGSAWTGGWPIGRPKSGGRGLAGGAQPGRSWVNWRFTTEGAGIKLKHLYPTTQG
jgi:hypothetical protein